MIDDSSTNNLLMHDVLEGSGYTVLTALSATDALTCLAENKKIDLILLDIMMPEIDGYQLLKVLKSHADYKNIPAFIVSAKVKAIEVDYAKSLGAVDYIRKPINFAELKMKIEQQLSIK